MRWTIFLQAVQELDGAFTIPDILAAIALNLSPTQFQRTLAFVRSLSNPLDDLLMERTLRALAPYITDALASQAVAIADSISLPASQLAALLALSPHLSVSQCERILDDLPGVVGLVDMATYCDN